MPQGYSGLPPFYLQSSDPITANLGLSLKGMDPIVAEDLYLIDQAFGSVGGTVDVNGTPVPNPNFVNSVTAVFSVVGSNISIAASGGGSSAWAALTGDLTETQVIPFDGGTIGIPDSGISRLDINQLAIGNGTATDITGGLTLGSIQLGPGDGAIDTNTFNDFGECRRVWAANRIFVPVPPVYSLGPNIGYIYPITSVTVNGSVLTVVGTNSLTVGQRVEFFSMTASFLDFQVVTVATASGTQFTARFVHANYATTADAGVAYVFSAIFALSVVAENNPAISNQFPVATQVLQSIVSNTTVTATALEFPKGPTALGVTTSHEGTGNFTS